MKKSAVFLLFFALSVNSFGQHTMTHEDYLLKGKRQNKIGWTLVLGGAAVAVVGSVLVVVIAHSMPAGAATMALGIISVPASIPFFIASGRNRKKAASLTFKNEMMSQVSGQNIVFRPIPSLALKFNLNKK